MEASIRPRNRARRYLTTHALLAMLAFSGAWSAASAMADGDPASDVLATQQLFLPQDAGVPGTQRAQLAGLLQQAARSGYPIRAALIASATDLGSVPALWRQPQNYAKFLGQELSLSYRGPLLVIMPNGLGLYHVNGIRAGTPPALAAPTSRSALGTAAVTAIQHLAAAAGHPLALPKSTVRAAPNGGSATPWIVFAIGALLIASAWTASLRIRPIRPGHKRMTPA